MECDGGTKYNLLPNYWDLTPHYTQQTYIYVVGQNEIHV